MLPVSPDRAMFPSGENATTLALSEYPTNFRNSRPEATSQSLSEAPPSERLVADKAVCPFGENATAQTKLWGESKNPSHGGASPTNVRSREPDARSHSSNVSALVPMSANLPSCVNATDWQVTF